MIDDYDSIWERLQAFGHVPTLLNIKLEELDQCTPVEKQKGESKINETLIEMRNVMKELSTLTTDHRVEHLLYRSSNLPKIYSL